MDWIQNSKGEHERLKYYASGIQRLQRELIDAGIASPQSLSKFPDIDIDEKYWLGLDDIDEGSESSEGYRKYSLFYRCQNLQKLLLVKHESDDY